MIPRIIHQIWIGPKPAPTNLMNTWKDMNPDFEYIRWDEEEFVKRGMVFECQSKIDEMEEYCGKTDIMRWEILYKYGGIYVDADSFCVQPLDDTLCAQSFAGWENEETRPGLIAVGTMGFHPHHEIPRSAIEFIQCHEVSYAKTGKMAWQNTGPVLLTNIYNHLPNKHILKIVPSYTFLPHHFTGKHYSGHGKIYAYQEWGSTHQSYDTLNGAVLGQEFTPPPPDLSISILVSSYNTKTVYLKECLESIKHQVGWFNMELVWVNDGSDALNTRLLKGLLDHFERTTRFTKVVYYENDTNLGISASLNKGVTLCSNDLIVRMDSDDIMVTDRIWKQLVFMRNNPTIQVCGGQIAMFRESPSNIINQTNHVSLTLDQYKSNPLHWLVNHPTLCYRKSAVLQVGNYDPQYNKIEDFELMLRMLKHCNYIHNLPDTLLYYRLHDKQVTHNGCTEGRAFWHAKRAELIQQLLRETA